MQITVFAMSSLSYSVIRFKNKSISKWVSLNPARLGLKMSFEIVPFKNTRSIAALDGNAVFDFMKIF